MSVTVSSSDGVTVFTLTTDPTSPWPPLCQMLKGLCYNPACCSVSQHLKKVQRTSQSVLGTLHIMNGLLNIGLGTILMCCGPASSWQMDSSGFPYWLGGLYVLFGIICILSEKHPSLCLVIFNVLMNIAGVAFAIAAIVLYSINIADIYLWWLCHEDYWWEDGGITKAPDDENMMKRCEEAEAVFDGLLKGINSLLIILSTLELCVAISSVVLGLKTVCGGVNGRDQSLDDTEGIKQLMEDA